MSDNGYKEKIKKLLSLSESPNENEAKAALMKAKRMMAEYKISEADLDELKSKKVRTVDTLFTCSKRREAWMVNLSTVIGQNFCCQAVRLKMYNKQTNRIRFIGLEDDIDVCISIFEYAVGCVRAGIKQIRKEYRYYGSDYVKQLSDGYGFGFADGVYCAFEEQKESDTSGWGLVMVTPAEVVEATKDLKRESFNGAAERQMSKDMYNEGYEDGKLFDPSTKLTGQEENLAVLGGVCNG